VITVVLGSELGGNLRGLPFPAWSRPTSWRAEPPGATPNLHRFGAGSVACRCGASLPRSIKRQPDHAKPRVDMPQLARQLKARGRPIVCWKYILFEHDDSIPEIVHAQELARRFGVDEMMFVLTHT